jgi:hypothetical protein
MLGKLVLKTAIHIGEEKKTPTTSSQRKQMLPRYRELWIEPEFWSDFPWR